MITNKITYKDVVENASNLFRIAGIHSAEHDSIEILLFVIKKNKMWYFVHMQDNICVKDSEKFEHMMLRRINHEPLQHIVGKAPFYGRDFIVNKDVFIPRFETEIIVDYIIKNYHVICSKVNNVKHRLKILDLCTGSGCIGITIALETRADVTCSDISVNALNTASANADKFLCNINFIHSDMFENITDTFDIIVSNPPYISVEEMKTLMSEVKYYDPYIALTDGCDGLKFYKIISNNALKYLTIDGILIIEIGYMQFNQIKKILEISGFRNIEVHKDLIGYNRMVIAYK